MGGDPPAGPDVEWNLLTPQHRPSPCVNCDCRRDERVNRSGFNAGGSTRCAKEIGRGGATFFQAWIWITPHDLDLTTMIGGNCRGRGFVYIRQSSASICCRRTIEITAFFREDLYNQETLLHFPGRPLPWRF